jgi:hypothetical protein
MEELRNKIKNKAVIVKSVIGRRWGSLKEAMKQWKGNKEYLEESESESAGRI